MSQQHRFLQPRAAGETRNKSIIAIMFTGDESGVFCAEHDSAVQHFPDLGSLWEQMQSRRYRGRVWYAHGAGEGEYTSLIPHFFAGIEAGTITQATPLVQANVRIIGWIIRREKQKIELRDSQVLLPGELCDIVPAFTGAAWPDTPSDQARALLSVLVRFRAILAREFETDMGWTAGSTALDAWRGTIDRHFIRNRPEVESYARAAYFGGLTYVHSTARHADVIKFDINACFAAAMRRGVPIGCGIYTLDYVAGRPGIYRIFVDCPAAVKQPMIGQRVDDGVYWRHGRFETTCTSMEIDAARQRGYTIEIIDGYLYDDIIKPFDTFIDQCETLETAHKTEPLGAAVKILRNSLYGKFGTRPDVQEYIIAAEQPDGYQFTIDPHHAELQIIEHLFWRATEREKSCMMPHWAAWITATARLMLIDLMERVGYDAVYYCDTDSLVVASAAAAVLVQLGVLPISTRYGDLKIEYDFTVFCASAPKQYYGELRGGGTIGRAKGISRHAATPEHAARAAAGETVTVAVMERVGALQVLQRGGGMQDRDIAGQRTYSRGGRNMQHVAIDMESPPRVELAIIDLATGQVLDIIHANLAEAAKIIREQDILRPDREVRIRHIA